MNNIKSVGKQRMNWIDWMKVIGMFLIVYGHAFPKRWSLYIYAFSVPLFFVISGFLTKREVDTMVFWKKIFFNLFLPLMIISAVSFLFYDSRLTGDYGIYSITKFIWGVLIGAHECLMECWFIYTLILLKIFYQFTPPYCEKMLTVILLLLFTVGAVSLSYNKCFLGNSFANALISYHFFVIGLSLKKYRFQLNEFCNVYVEVVLFVFALMLIYFCPRFNGSTWVYINDYGRYFTLYMLGGFAGTVFVYILSKWLNKVKLRVVSVISQGSILILGFHYNLIGIIDRHINNVFFTSVIIMLLFVPFIVLCEKYFPYILGVYRIKRK